jgi:tetratricopeptide (TPR) repeat protein
MLRGQWQEALPLLERAGALEPKSHRIADNVELARAAIAEDLPRRRAGESDTDWSARLNDAGVIAAAGGQRQRAIAAFAQALEASSQWYQRAANNLAVVEGRK